MFVANMGCTARGNSILSDQVGFHGKGDLVPSKFWPSGALGSASCSFCWAFGVLLSSWGRGSGSRERVVVQVVFIFLSQGM